MGQSPLPSDSWPSTFFFSPLVSTWSSGAQVWHLSYLHSQEEHTFQSASWGVSRSHLPLSLTCLRQVPHSLQSATREMLKIYSAKQISASHLSGLTKTCDCFILLSPIVVDTGILLKSQFLQLHSNLCFSRHFLHTLFQLILTEPSAAGVALLSLFYRCDTSTDWCSDSPWPAQQSQGGVHFSTQIPDQGPVLWATSLSRRQWSFGKYKRQLLA